MSVFRCFPWHISDHANRNASLTGKETSPAAAMRLTASGSSRSFSQATLNRANGLCCPAKPYRRPAGRAVDPEGAVWGTGTMRPFVDASLGPPAALFIGVVLVVAWLPEAARPGSNRRWRSKDSDVARDYLRCFGNSALNPDFLVRKRAIASGDVLAASYEISAVPLG